MVSRGYRLLVSAAARRLWQGGHGRSLALAVPQFCEHLCRSPMVTSPHWTPTWLSSMTKPNRSVTTEVLGDKVTEERRRRLFNRILYRSRQRGYLELDILLGQWATDHIHELDDKELGALAEILEEENPDLLSWITGQSDVPERIASNPVFSAIHKDVSEKLVLHSARETRAQQGQPWVRGWDDNRQVGGPQVGNQ